MQLITLISSYAGFLARRLAQLSSDSFGHGHDNVRAIAEDHQ
jgi:hypothetical protein